MYNIGYSSRTESTLAPRRSPVGGLAPLTSGKPAVLDHPRSRCACSPTCRRRLHEVRRALRLVSFPPRSHRKDLAPGPFTGSADVRAVACRGRAARVNSPSTGWDESPRVLDRLPCSSAVAYPAWGSSPLNSSDSRSTLGPRRRPDHPATPNFAGDSVT